MHETEEHLGIVSCCDTIAIALTVTVIVAVAVLTRVEESLLYSKFVESKKNSQTQKTHLLPLSRCLCMHLVPFPPDVKLDFLGDLFPLSFLLRCR